MFKLKIQVLTISVLFVIGAKGQPSEKLTNSKPTLALKAGLNFANVTGASSINGSSRNGFMAGVYFAPPASTFGYRTEVIFSRQGYHYEDVSASGNISQDYLLLPQLTTINITKRLQIQLGAQVGILLKAKDSSVSVSGAPYSYKPATDYFNKLRYDIVGGVELYPFKGLLIGGRANFNLNSMTAENDGVVRPPYIPSDKSKLKNNLVQLFVGWRF